MAASGGINLRVTAHLSQGGRKYMEDMFTVAYERTQDNKDLKYAFFAIFDGHGGQEAAKFAKDNLMNCIVRQEGFWCERDEDVLRAIYDGFVKTQLSMWRNLENWPKTSSGLPSTSGTTASVAFIKKNKLYIGHVGDSSIALGFQTQDEKTWKAQMLTEDHKPECALESERIRNSGGRVVVKAGVPRIVWNRPRIGHSGPVRRSTQFDEIPFLAVARSLGDLWSYNAESNQFVVSPEPDVTVTDLNPGVHRCLIFATDGLWNMLTAAEAVDLVQKTVLHNNEQMVYAYETGKERPWINPSKKLVEKALEKWKGSQMRADNTSALTILLNPCGPPHAEVLSSQMMISEAAVLEHSMEAVPHPGQLVSQPCVTVASGVSDAASGCDTHLAARDSSSVLDVVTFTRHPIVHSGMEYEDVSEVECLGEVEDAWQVKKSVLSSIGDGSSEIGVAKMLSKEGGSLNNKATPRVPKLSASVQTCGNCANKKEKRVSASRQAGEGGAKCRLFRLSESLLSRNSCIHDTHVGKRNKSEIVVKPNRRLSESVLGRNLLGQGCSLEKTNVRDLGLNRSRRSSEGTLRCNPQVYNTCDENDINRLNPKHCRKPTENSVGQTSLQSSEGQTNKAKNHLFGTENFRILKSAKMSSAGARSDRMLRSSGSTHTLLSRNVNANTVATAVAQDVKNKRGLSPCTKVNSTLHAGLKSVPHATSPLRKKLRSSDWSTVQPMVTRSQANRRHSK